ncbi:polyribonucleotide nucleotidyltransferase [Massilicoli timonensis]|uniref:polyribonucleotide nucleotidyltransferase n=1 Tax=Massilicoli timonensis TaxID=2015901 RepID=UPI0015B4842C|nr:polyribonucleotide nucleotidyltransferase [Massilicoli timonensis]
MAKQVFSMDFCGRTLTVETGEIAKQAGGSALVRYNDTVVLSTATASKQAKEGIDFFPLTVTFEEKLYSVGKIPGGFLRREGRPSEHATLSARMIDRPIRPLFADGFRNEVQVVNTVLSVEQDCDPAMTAMLGASLALCLSDIPFNGPIAGVIVGRVDGEYVINPSQEQMERTDIVLHVAGTKYAVNMVEAGAKEVSEEAMLGAILFGHEHIKKLVAFQEEIVAAAGKAKRQIELYEIPAALNEEVRALVQERMVKAVQIHEKLERYDAIDALEAEMVEHYEAKEYESEKSKAQTIKFVKEICHDITKEEVRRLITVEKVRPDGRKLDEIRPLDSQVDILPRVHGSALFTRGETQVLSVCTLGPLNDNQIIDDVTEVESKRFMHHYNFPPYSVGETGRMGSPGRREIGHGALGERALSQVIPSVERFPYTIRLVAEVLESNGSSSQASICAGTMALMAAGVPISAPVAGIAMGLVKQGEHYTILSDIQGMEDHLGDMDFKVAGTPKGITALQMDIKIDGLSKEIFEEALAQAKIGRAQILENMLSAISEVRSEVGRYAPKIHQMHIPVDKIPDVIGPKGKMINQIIEACNDVQIDIEDDGKVIIYHMDKEPIEHAAAMIEDVIREAKVGDVFEGEVVRIESFGAFVHLFSSTDGLLHISEISHERVEKVEDALKLGDKVKVKVIKIDNKGRVNVSAKALLKRPKKEKKAEPKKETAETAVSEGEAKEA